MKTLGSQGTDNISGNSNKLQVILSNDLATTEYLQSHAKNFN